MSVKMKEAVSFQESRAVKPHVAYYVTTREDAFTLMENTPQPCAHKRVGPVSLGQIVTSFLYLTLTRQMCVSAYSSRRHQ